MGGGDYMVQGLGALFPFLGFHGRPCPFGHLRGQGHCSADAFGDGNPPVAPG